MKNTMLHSPTVLYRYYDEYGVLLYIGISKSALVRLAQHQCNSWWACEIATVKLERLETREKALIAEYEAIIKEKPAHNKMVADPRIKAWGTSDDI